MDATLEDAKEIVQGRPYHWKDWCVVRGRDCLYLWSDVAALELSNGSNGWFRFILDGKLATMYSSGSPEGGSDSSGLSHHNFVTLILFLCSVAILETYYYYVRLWVKVHSCTSNGKVFSVCF